jgi:DNA primase
MDKLNEYLQTAAQDFIIYRAQQLITAAGDEPNKKAESVKAISRIIALVPDQTRRAYYMDYVTTTHRLPRKMVKFEIDENIKYTVEGATEPGAAISIESAIPAHALEDFRAWGFYEDRNSYIFLNKDNLTQEISNFVIKPLYHIDSKVDNKRLIEITNQQGIKKICDMPSKNFAGVDMFQQSIINEGNYLFFGSKFHYYKILAKIMRNFPMVNEPKTLGWHSKGFYAYSNGIYADKWLPVDNFGIAEYNGEKYFFPAFSCVYAGVSDDEDQYENDRFILYKPAPIKFKQWASLMLEVYGDNARVAIAFYIAALFRDSIYQKYKMFPHLFLFGEKESGKSQLAWSLSNLCNYSLPPFNLNSGTQVGFFRRLARVKNGIAWYDEYTNNIDEKRHQALKSAYDGVGHEKGKMSQDNRTEITKVSSAVIMSGQYLPTRDDNALFTRSILLSFEKKIYTAAHMAKFNELKTYEENGITGLLTELLPYREAIEKKYGMEFSNIYDKLKSDLQKKGAEFEERLLRNFCTILTPFKIVTEAGLEIPHELNYTFLYAQAIKMIPELSSAISSSEALAMFWEMVGYLFEEFKIRERYDYNIESCPLDGVLIHKNGNKERLEFPAGTQLLYIRFSKIHPLYMEYHRKQYGSNGVDMVSLKHYIYHSPAFIGQQEKHRFGSNDENTVSSCYVFKYEMLSINLEKNYTGGAVDGDPQPAQPHQVHKQTDIEFKKNTAPDSTQPPF